MIGEEANVAVPVPKAGGWRSRLVASGLLGHCASLALLILLVHVLLTGSMPGRYPSFDDEELVLTLSKLVTTHGMIQYRDFGHDYMPLTFYIWGALMNLFGGDIYGLRIAVWLMDMLVAPILVFLIGIKMTRSRIASLAAVFFYYVFSSGPLLKATVFLAAVATIIYCKRKPPREHLFIGLAVAICGFTGQEFGVFIVLTYGAALCYDHFCFGMDRMLIFRRLAWAAAGAAILLVPFLTLYLVTGSLSAFFYHSVIKGFFSTPGTMNLPYPFAVDLSEPINWMYYFFLLVLGLAVYYLFFGPGLVRRSDAHLIIVAFIVSFTVATGRADSPHLAMGLVMFGLLAAYVLMEAPAWSGRSVSSAAVKPFAILVPVAVTVIEYWILARNVTRYRWQLVLAVGLGAATCALLREEETEGPAVRRRGSLSVFVFLAAAITFFRYPALSHMLQQANTDVHHRHLVLASFQIPKADPDDIFGVQFEPDQLTSIRKVKELIDSQTAPSENILVFPQHAFLYLLLNRPNPTANYQFIRSIQPKEVSAVIKKMDEVRPRFVVYDKELASDLGTGVNWYLLRNYKLLADTGWLQVLQRSEQPNNQLPLEVKDFRPDTAQPEFVYANYLKTGVSDVAGGSYADAIFQHPPLAEKATLRTAEVFDKLKMLRFEVLGNPQSAADVGRARALIRLRGAKSFEPVFSKEFIDSQDRRGTADFTIPAQGVDALQLESTLANGTFWRIMAVY